MTSRPYIALTITTALLSAYGCSLINAPEDVDYGSLGGAAGDGDGDGDRDTGGTAGDGDGDTGGNPGDGDGDVEMPPEAPTTGLVVLAGAVGEDADRLLSVINSRTGKEIEREKLQAVSVAYDGAEDRYLWFVFVSSRVSPGQNTLAELQVRYYRDGMGWETISKTSALPPPLLRGDSGAASSGPTSLFSPVVLNGRLAYISQGVDGGAAKQGITILDTSDPSKVELVETRYPADMDRIVGLVGRRGRDLDVEAVGGSLTLMISRGCPDSCELFGQPVNVANNISSGVAAPFGAYTGIPAFASTPVLPDSVARPFKAIVPSLGAYALAFAPAADRPVRWSFNPADPADLVAPSTLADAKKPSLFSSLAVAECLGAGVVASEPNQDLVSFHPNGNVFSAPLLHDALQVSIDPFTNNVLTMKPAGAAGLSVRAFQIEKVGMGMSETLTLVERSTVSWDAPDDIDPIMFAVRTHEKNDCQ